MSPSRRGFLSRSSTRQTFVVRDYVLWHTADDFADLPDLVGWIPPADFSPYVALVADPILAIQHINETSYSH